MKLKKAGLGSNRDKHPINVVGRLIKCGRCNAVWQIESHDVEKTFNIDVAFVGGRGWTTHVYGTCPECEGSLSAYLSEKD